MACQISSREQQWRLTFALVPLATTRRCLGTSAGAAESRGEAPLSGSGLIRRAAAPRRDHKGSRRGAQLAAGARSLARSATATSARPSDHCVKEDAAAHPPSEYRLCRSLTQQMECLEKRARILLANRDPGGALSDATAVIEAAQPPDVTARALVLRSEAFVALGEYERAFNDLRRAAALAPSMVRWGSGCLQ